MQLLAAQPPTLPLHCINKVWPQQPYAYTCLLLVHVTGRVALQKQSIAQTGKAWRDQVEQAPSRPTPTHHLHHPQALYLPTQIRPAPTRSLTVRCCQQHSAWHSMDYCGSVNTRHHPTKHVYHDYMQLSATFSGIPSTSPYS